MMSKPQCEDHAELVADLATAQERARSLEHGRDEITAAILAMEGRLTMLDQRLVGVKLQLAKWGGVIAAVAALPLILQIAQIVIRAAEAAGGQP